MNFAVAFEREGDELSLAFHDLEAIPTDVANNDGPHVRTLGQQVPRPVPQLVDRVVFLIFFVFSAASRDRTPRSKGRRK